MHLETIILKDFRLFEAEAFHFQEGVNFICGANGQGKTSLLEAVYCLVCGRSFRTKSTADCLRQGADAFSVEAKFIKQGVDQRLQIFSDGKEKRVVHNATPLRSLTALLGLIPAVVMTPDDQALIKGAPQVRRRLFDLHLSQIDPLYVHHLMRYARAMNQRNHLLRKGETETMEVWEEQMALSGSYVTQARSLATEELSQGVQESYSSIANDSSSVALRYRPAGSMDRVELFKQYRAQRSKELEARCSLVGPHRDELMITLNEKEAKAFASEGQMRSLVAAIRLSEWKRLKEITVQVPLMMIDDLGISLDLGRRRRLLELTEGLGQVFLTGTHPDVDHLYTIELGSNRCLAKSC